MNTNSCGTVKKGTLVGVVFGAILFAGVSVAHATVIRGAESVSTSIVSADEALHGIRYINDQSGLSDTYTNGVTDFDTFTSATTHNWEPENAEWWGEYGNNDGPSTGTITFDLGGVFTVDKIAFWNEDWAGISQFSVFASQNATDNLVGTFNLDFTTYTESYLAQISIFGTAVDTQYLTFSLVADMRELEWGLEPTLSIGEVAFSTEPVPEPATLLLFGTGILGLLGMRRKKR